MTTAKRERKRTGLSPLNAYCSGLPDKIATQRINPNNNNNAG